MTEAEELHRRVREAEKALHNARLDFQQRSGSWDAVVDRRRELSQAVKERDAALDLAAAMEF